MSRFGEGEEDFPGQYQLWRSNVRRAISGRKGQQALHDLEAALLALPAPRLIDSHLAHQGEVCAVGALVAHRRVTRGEEREAVLTELEALAPPLCECGHPEIHHKDGSCSDCVEADKRRRVAWVERPPACPREYEPHICAAFEDADYSDDYGDITVAAGKAVGLTYVLAWEMSYTNDEEFGRLTPEERYIAVLDWVRAHYVAVPA